MTEAAAAAPGRPERRRVPLWLDILVTALFALLFARLIYLPQARPLGAADTLTAPAGQWLVLDGLDPGEVLDLTADVPGEVRMSAPSAALDPASRAYLRSVGLDAGGPAHGAVGWVASATGKATLIADLTVAAPNTRLALSVIPGAAGVTLRIERGALTASLRLESPGPARALLDLPGAPAAQALGPGRPLAVLLTPGGSPDPALGFGISGPLSLRLLRDDGSDAPLALTGLEIDAGGAVLTRTCGGAPGGVLFQQALLQPRARPLPPPSACRPGRMTLGALTLQPGSLVAAPSGSGYVPGELPVWNTLKSNPAIGALLLAIIGYPAARLLSELRGLLKPARAAGDS